MKEKRPFSGVEKLLLLAMAIANLVQEESLGGISAYARVENGYTFCTCSVNQYFCNHKHAQYKLETPAEFRRYLPLAIASFATGNNIWGEISRRDGGGHYLTLASIYEGGLYILDPYLKADYGKTDRRHLITQIEPGGAQGQHGRPRRAAAVYILYR